MDKLKDDVMQQSKPGKKSLKYQLFWFATNLLLPRCRPLHHNSKQRNNGCNKRNISKQKKHQKSRKEEFATNLHFSVFGLLHQN